MATPKDSGYLIPVEHLDRGILLIRGQRVMLDADLAALFGVSARALNQAIKRNLDRFPTDFLIQLSPEEKAEVITNCDHLSGLRFSHHLPFAFTEHGAVMAATVLNSKRAVEVSVFVVRAFVRMRQMLASHRQLALKLAVLFLTGAKPTRASSGDPRHVHRLACQRYPPTPATTRRKRGTLPLFSKSDACQGGKSG